MPTSTRFALPVPPLTFKEKSSSTRENTVQSYLTSMGNSLDDDVNRLELVIGIAADGVEANINYSSNRVVVDGEDPITSIGRLDAAMALNVDYLHSTIAVLNGQVYTSNSSLTLTANAGTDVMTSSANHGMAAGHGFRLKSSGSLPGGLSTSTTYYAGTITSNTFKVYLTQANAISGTSPVDITTTGTGTHSFNGAYVIGNDSTAFDTQLAGGNYVYIDSLTIQTYGVSSVESAKVLLLTSETTQTYALSNIRKLDVLSYPIVATNQLKLTVDPVLGDDAIRKSYLDTRINSVSAKGTDIPSATALPVAADYQYFHVTGTTTITGISQASGLFTGREVELRIVDGLQFTHSANLLCPKDQNITTYAGDILSFRCEDATTPIWRVTKIMRNINTVFSDILSDQTVTGVASVDFTNLDATKYRYFELQILEAVPATDGVSAWFRMSTNNGSSYAAGASDYESTGLAPTGGTFDYVNSTAAQAVINPAAYTIGNVSTEGLSGLLRLTNMGSTTSYKDAVFSGRFRRTTGAIVHSGTSISYISTTAVNAFQFLFSSGNVASGRFILRGFR